MNETKRKQTRIELRFFVVWPNIQFLLFILVFVFGFDSEYLPNPIKTVAIERSVKPQSCRYFVSMNRSEPKASRVKNTLHLNFGFHIDAQSAYPVSMLFHAISNFTLTRTFK